MTDVKRNYTPPAGRVIVFQVALEPTSKQISQFQSHLGAVRYTYNWTLALLKENYEARKADPTIEKISIAHTPILKLWTQRKREESPWWNENAKEAYDTGIDNAVSAFKHFFKSKDDPKSHKFGYPRFKKRSEQNQIGCMFNATVRLDESSNHLYLSRIGKVKYHGNASSIKWLLSYGARITQGALKYNHNRWTFSFFLRVPDVLAYRYYQTKYKKDLRSGKKAKNVVGIDLGLKVFTTQSDGIQVPNAQYLRKAEKKLRRAHKEFSRKRNSYEMVQDENTGIQKKQWSKRRQEAKNKLAKHYARVYNLRNDFTHQYSTWLIKTYDTIAVEYLNVSGMVRNRHLSKSISDASWRDFLNKLKYKSENSRFLNEENGTEIRVIDRFVPSSKTCAQCGSVRAKLSLAERTFRCDECGNSMDRDLNAAINILNLTMLTKQVTAKEIKHILRPWVTGESKIGQTGAHKLSPRKRNHLDAELSNQDKLSSASNNAMLYTSNR